VQDTRQCTYKDPAYSSTSGVLKATICEQFAHCFSHITLRILLAISKSKCFRVLGSYCTFKFVVLDQGSAKLQR